MDEAQFRVARRVLSERTADGKRLSAGDLARMVEEEFDQSGLGDLLDKMPACQKCIAPADEEWLLKLADKLSPGGHQVLIDPSVGRLWAARLRAIVGRDEDD